MFQGFSPDTQNFLWELSFHNERSWFSQHKEEFDQGIYLPFRELGNETYRLLNEEYPLSGMDVHISRIYRDARRLYGRGPYKDHLWFSIKDRTHGYNGAAFFFEINPREYCYGLGFYCEKSSGMEAFRQSVDQKLETFRELAKGVEALPGLTVGGPEYRRPKRDYGEEVNAWVNRKYVDVTAHRDYDDLLQSPELPRVLFETYRSLMPMYEFLSQGSFEVL